jgi:uncharacterized protein
MLYIRLLWQSVRSQFPDSRNTVRPDIVKKMIECGLRVSAQGGISVGDVEVDYTAVAKAVGVDRRVVKDTVTQIRANPYLFSIFSRIRPMGASVVEIVGELGYTAIVIEGDPKSPGIMAAVAEILARHGMVVRQALADDPEMVPEAKLTLVIAGPLTGQAMEELNGLKSIKSMKILK